MEGIKKLIELAKADGGKFFVIDENGDPVLVIMTTEQYQEVLLRAVHKQTASVEEINKKIIEAQKQEEADLGREREREREREKERERELRRQEQDHLKSEIIDSTFSFED